VKEKREPDFILHLHPDYVVSGDKHVREIKHSRGVRIIDVETFAGRVRKGTTKVARPLIHLSRPSTITN
jgi:hypothetical protein